MIDKKYSKAISIIVLGLLLLTLAACRNRESEITLHFDTQGGQTISDLSLKESETLPTLPNPIKEGHTFLGWTHDVSTKTLFSKDAIDWDLSMMTLYALWEVNSYTISFVTHINEVIEPSTYDFGESISLPTLERLGYQFNGWFADQAFTTLFTTETMPAENITLYASWLKDDEIFGLNTFYFETSTHTEDTLIITFKVDGDVQFAGYDIELTYNTNKLTLTSYQNHVSNIVNDTVSGKIIFNYVDVLNRIVAPTELITLTFTILNPEDITINTLIKELIDVTETYDIINVNYSIIPFTLDE